MVMEVREEQFLNAAFPMLVMGRGSGGDWESATGVFVAF